MFLRRWLSILRRAAVLAYTSRCMGIAKAAAYSALLAFFPVLTTVAILLVRFRARAVSQVLAQQLQAVVPPGSEALVINQFTVRGQRPAAVLVFSILLAIYAASGIMLSLIEGFDTTYKVRSRSILHQRGIAALLVILAVIPAVTASALILLGDQTERWALGIDSPLSARGTLLLGQATRVAISLVCASLGAAMLYRLAPNKPLSWGDAFPGAVTATVLWYVATWIFRFYVANVANYNVLYGSVAAVIALGVWLYLLALIALYGCAINAVRK